MKEEHKWKIAVLFGLAVIIVLSILRLYGAISEENYVAIVVMIVTALLGIKRVEEGSGRRGRIAAYNLLAIGAAAWLALNALLTGSAAAPDWRAAPLALFALAVALGRAECARVWWT